MQAKRIIAFLLFMLLFYGLATFLVECWNYQIVYLPTVWEKLSFQNQTLANINLGFIDLKIVLAIIGIILTMLYFEKMR